MPKKSALHTESTWKKSFDDEAPFSLEFSMESTNQSIPAKIDAFMKGIGRLLSAGKAANKRALQEELG